MQTFCHFNKKKTVLAFYNVILRAYILKAMALKLIGAPWEQAFPYTCERIWAFHWLQKNLCTSFTLCNFDCLQFMKLVMIVVGWLFCVG
jgi:hypothetical protein